jgi:NAD(P)-dependent dehydrogenase (short-subunit alcohol dehydrogenase family)
MQRPQRGGAAADAKALDQAAERFRGAGQEVRGEIVDVTDRGALARSFEAIAQHYGRLDVVFANAGIGGGPGFLKLDGERNPDCALENFPADVWDRIIAIDLTSVFATLQAAARHMKNKGGRLRGLSSSTFRAGACKIPRCAHRSRDFRRCAGSDNPTTSKAWPCSLLRRRRSSLPVPRS